jgi:cyclopropane fatty-acyl-phospholipid synthase-like methyltransferase
MSPVEPTAIVRAGYDAIGAGYHARSADKPLRIAYVERLRDRLPAGSTVLELGCGPGDPATRLLAERHRVVAVDLSRGQLDLARGHAPTAALVQADIARLAVRPGSVDAVASFFAFGHLPSAAHAPFLAGLGGWLRPGGLLTANAPLTPGDGVDEWLGVPMFFGGIGVDATLAALRSGGLEIESAEALSDEPGETFLWIEAAKPC